MACVGSGLSLAGISPILGPGRALSLAASSYVARSHGPKSVRADEVASLRRWFTNNLGDTDAYRVIIGEKGVGKTYMLRSALHRMPGVVSVIARPAESESEICTNALKEIGKRTSWSIGDPIRSAKRAIACYRFIFRRSPIVVIRASERPQAKAPADIAGAVRTLTDIYKLRVVVDSSPNSLDPGVLGTEREIVMQLERIENKYSRFLRSRAFSKPLMLLNLQNSAGKCSEVTRKSISLSGTISSMCPRRQIKSTAVITLEIF